MVLRGREKKKRERVRGEGGEKERERKRWPPKERERGREVLIEPSEAIGCLRTDDASSTTSPTAIEPTLRGLRVAEPEKGL